MNLSVKTTTEQTSTTNRIFAEKDYHVNLYKNTFLSLSEVGRIFIDDNMVMFKPRILTFRIFTPQQRTFLIKDICGYKRSGLTILTILLNNRIPYIISTYSKNEIVNELEVRRKFYYQSRKLPIPPLQCI